MQETEHDCNLPDRPRLPFTDLTPVVEYSAIFRKSLRRAIDVHSTGIFENDLARDVRREFEQFMRAGLSAYAAADRVIALHAAHIHDPDDEPAIFFALAELQLQCGALSPPLRKRALTIINSGDSLARWSGQSAETIAARNAIEQDLRRRLSLVQ